jgi:DNA invertase Pin-like site-specific DNA recombinase
MRAAIYARVSTSDQTVANQLLELRRYIDARGWTAVNEYVDVMSGAKDRRPGLDALVRDARRRKFDAVVVWKLDRLGRSLRHLVLLMEELQQLGVALVSLGEGLDLSTPAGRLQAGLLAVVASFERERIRERVMSGLQRAKAQGKALGRPKAAIPIDRLATVASLSLTDAAEALGVSRSTLKRWRRGQKTLASVA